MLLLELLLHLQSLSGVGTNHTLEVHGDVATIRSFISIDNVIQSPLAKKILPLTLSSQVSIGTDRVFLHDISDLKGKDLIQINNEIMKVDLVGIGSTNSLNVIRGIMGTVAAAHTVGAAITSISGDYRIKKVSYISLMHHMVQLELELLQLGHHSVVEHYID